MWPRRKSVSECVHISLSLLVSLSVHLSLPLLGRKGRCGASRVSRFPIRAQFSSEWCHLTALQKNAPVLFLVAVGSLTCEIINNKWLFGSTWRRLRGDWGVTLPIFAQCCTDTLLFRLEVSVDECALGDGSSIQLSRKKGQQE